MLSTIATIDFVSLSSNNNHEITDMSGIPNIQMSCRLDTLADMQCRRVGNMNEDMSPTCRWHDTPCLQMKAWEDMTDEDIPC